MLVAGEETNESLSTWPRAAAAQQSSEREGSERERETERGGKRHAVDGRGSRLCIDGGKKRTGFLWAVFSVSLRISFFFFLSLLIFYSY